MPLMSTCLGRLGSRYSLILDPHRRQVHYGTLGLMCQMAGELLIGLDDARGTLCTLPLTTAGEPFTIVDQQLTMTSVAYEAHSVELGLSLAVEIVAPFWPQDQDVSTVPAYVVHCRVRRLDRVRWTAARGDAARRGFLRVAVALPGVEVVELDDALELRYPVVVHAREGAAESEQDLEPGSAGRNAPTFGSSVDRVVPLTGDWAVRHGCIEAPYDVDDGGEATFSFALASHCGDALFERLGKPMTLRYASRWGTIDDVAAYVRDNHARLCEASRAFDALWADSSLPAAVQDLSALSFQSYLMCTLWAVGDDDVEWFSVWEGSCWYNSTVDVTYNEAMFYFACWPQILERIFDQWAAHVNDAAHPPAGHPPAGHPPAGSEPAGGSLFPGGVLEHDMGSGWTANGQSYHHAMPVEENANFLLLLYAHGTWWGRAELFRKFNVLNIQLAEYLLWADSTGNGFPDRGTANTIDDATPAVQYGRDNVYLGIKRLAALHAASRMFAHVGEKQLARRCAAEVKKAVKTLQAGCLDDHYPVCLDKTTDGLADCWSGEPLPDDTLPGWDAYSLYTTNGLLYLLMVDDLPPGIDRERLRRDALAACRHTMTTYGCGHSSGDKANVWVSMNVWRDCAAAYLGENLLANAERYWAQQLFANGPGAEKPNCFTETSLTNNLVWYPRGAATFGLPGAVARIVRNQPADTARIDPIAPGRWPLLPLADWAEGAVPVAITETIDGAPTTRIEGAGHPVQIGSAPSPAEAPEPQPKPRPKAERKAAPTEPEPTRKAPPKKPAKTKRAATKKKTKRKPAPEPKAAEKKTSKKPAKKEATSKPAKKKAVKKRATKKKTTSRKSRAKP